MQAWARIIVEVDYFFRLFYGHVQTNMEKRKGKMFSGELHEMSIFEITSGLLLSETEW